MPSEQEPNPNMNSPKLSKKVRIIVPKVKFLKSEKRFSLSSLLIFILVFAAIGGYILYRSFAAGVIVASVQAESMSLPAGASVISDSSASGGQAMKLTQNGTSTVSFSLPSQAASLTVTARGDQCQGSPTITIAVDGKTLLANTGVGSNTYTIYSASSLNLSGSSHTLSVTGAGLGGVYKGKSANPKCYRNLYLDVTNFYGPDVVLPTVSLSANPTTINSGASSTLSWSSANATSCTASFTSSTATSDSISVSPTATTTYSITCTGSGSSATSSTTVTVNASTGTYWPASYLNGPLGTNNILPNTQNGVLLIENFGDQGNTIPQQEAGIQQRETDIGRKFDGLHTHYGGGGTYNGYANCIYLDSYKQEQWAHDRGSVPIVSWSPNATLANINSGNWDGCIAAVANYYKQFPFRVMMRLMWEQDGNWMVWRACDSTLAGSTPQGFISAWQRMVNIFKQQGANNVGFWWTPTEGYNRACADQTYPGDAYVDWVGVDSYNHDRNDVWDSPLHNGWSELNENLNYDKLGSSVPSKQSEWGPRKPFVLGESATKYDTTGVPSGHVVDPNRKANWFRNIATVTAPNSTYLRGISFFDQWVSSEYNDWHVDHNQPGGVSIPEGSFDATSYQGFIDMTHAAVFNSGVAGGAN